ncbi:preprotein translocase subunit SecG [Allochromatium tepidum]|uniref:Protein-export membrane protein SecG n=1 Tax=Allochromatium tepidum TaxID=553982 RepID=A0ABM7QKD1_9GAMM|nr:preprotein translocase subunit SecG [Allochromatium tepidum]BCU06248.1 protein-export membrane protein SecG [Allochromatium tepidum]
MQTILTVLQVFLSLGLIGLVLIQHGKGADAGAAFGSGASATVFGAQGSGSFLTRLTAILATLFFLTSMALAYYATQASGPAGLMDKMGDAIIVPSSSPVESVPRPTSSDVPAIPGAGSISDVPMSADVPVAPIESTPSRDDSVEVGNDGQDAEEQ